MSPKDGEEIWLTEIELALMRTFIEQGFRDDKEIAAILRRLAYKLTA